MSGGTDGGGQLNPKAEDLKDLEQVYKDFHEHPELSMQEHRTSGIVAERMNELGYEVTEGVGGTSVVCVLENGDGPIVMCRADMDALGPQRLAPSLRTSLPTTAPTTPRSSTPRLRSALKRWSPRRCAGWPAKRAERGQSERAGAGSCGEDPAESSVGLIACLAFAVGAMVGGRVFTLSGTAINEAAPATRGAG